jgi:hypothetical protein
MNLSFNFSHGHCINANAFASTFYFFADTLINAKKIKRACKPTHQDSGKMDIHSENGLESTTGNRRLAQWRVTWLIEHSNSHQLLWCFDSFVLRNPPLRQAPNR